jgi:lipopolysaccharide transport system permease protein
VCRICPPARDFAMIKNLRQHRRYLLGSLWSDFRFRYAGTMLGFFWFVVTPLLEAVLYSVIFSFLIGARSKDLHGDSYILFLLNGLLPWFAFTHLIVRGSNALNLSALYLRRLPIPTDVFIAREALVAMVSLFIYVLLLLPINLAFGNSLSWHVLLLPVLVLLFIALGYGIVLSLAHLRVFFSDLGEILGLLIQLWRWTLPINYSFNIFPEHIRSIFMFNPPYYFLTAFRGIFMEKELPSIAAWSHMIGWILIFISIGSFVSSRLSNEVKDQV